MFSGLYKAATGMSQESQRQELIAANLAGASTPGFKGRQLVTGSFSAELAQAAGGAASGGPHEVSDYTQGSLTQTGRPLDIAIQGEGFLRCRSADNTELLTRNGGLTLDPDGTLQTMDGHRVMSEGGAREITIPPGTVLEDLQFKADGALVVRVAEGGEAVLGRLDLVTCEDPQRLSRAGSGSNPPRRPPWRTAAWNRRTSRPSARWRS
jgi:flagellar basal-body rod protein FlgF